MSPAISGQGGHRATLEAACTLFRFGLDADIAQMLLSEYNTRCQPQWEPYELGRKVNEAQKIVTEAGEIGKLLNNTRNESQAGQADPSQLFEKFGVRPAMSTLELLDSTDVDEYLIEGALVMGQPFVAAGQSKTMKTTLCIDAAVSLATATSFLGVHRVPESKRVLFFTAEIGKATCRETVRSIANARGVENQLRSAGEMIHWGTWVPYIPNDEHLDIVEQEFERTRPDVVVFDPLYQMLDGETAANYALNGQQLRRLSLLCESRGVTPIFVDHCKKGSDNAKNRDPLELEDISGAGKAEFFRQWCLISRRQPYDPDLPHELWVTIGGSAGHSAIWALTIDEGRDFENRRGYLLTAKPRSELLQEKKAARVDRAAQRDAEHAERIAKKAKELIDRVYRGDRTLCLSKAKIKEHMRLNADNAGQLIAHLIESRELQSVPGGAVQNGRQYDGYRLIDGLSFGPDNQDNPDVS